MSKEIEEAMIEQGQPAPVEKKLSQKQALEAAFKKMSPAQQRSFLMRIAKEARAKEANLAKKELNRANSKKRRKLQKASRKRNQLN